MIDVVKLINRLIKERKKKQQQICEKLPMMTMLFICNLLLKQPQTHELIAN